MAKDRSLEGVIDCSKDPVLTQQSGKDECDVNLIVERAKRGADLSLFARSPNAPMYGDFTNLPDYRSALLMVTKAREMFMRLDPNIRERFANNPALMLDFLEDPKNRDEAVKLGLVNPPKPSSEAKAVEGSKAGPGAGETNAKG